MHRAQRALRLDLQRHRHPQHPRQLLTSLSPRARAPRARPRLALSVKVLDLARLDYVRRFYDCTLRCVY